MAVITKHKSRLRAGGIFPLTLNPQRSYPKKDKERYCLLTIIGVLMVTILFLHTGQFSFDDGGSFEFNSIISGSGSGSGSEKKIEYVPAGVEQYIMSNMKKLGYNNANWREVFGCKIWKSPEESTPENYQNLLAYKNETAEYFRALKEFDEPIGDIFDVIRDNKSEKHHTTCKNLRLHPDGLMGIFQSGQLSLTKAGYVEPLVTPLRHPDYCFLQDRYNKFRIDYVVHDYEAMCKNMKPTSKRVLIDIGTSAQQPFVDILKNYEKFGFNFDYIYAFDREDPLESYKEFFSTSYFATYKWINEGTCCQS